MSAPAASGPKSKVPRLVVALVGAVVLVSLVVWLAVVRMRATEYASFPSPDGRYRVVVLRTPAWPSVTPGQAGDAPGKVRLYDREGKLLREADVPMVQLVDRVEWTDTLVHIKLVADWKLPARP